MRNDLENVRQAKDSFSRILDNKMYAGIIKDDKHLAILLNLIKGGNYQKILDIGTGTGYLAFPLSEEYSAAVVYGIDIAENIIEKNNALVKEKGISNLIFQAFDGLKYPFDDESFDLIVTRYAFHHFPNVKEAICQMNKLLRKGGKVLVSDPMRNKADKNKVIDEYMKVKKDGHIQFYSESEIDELFSNSGFIKDDRIITEMKFPFAPRPEYLEVYNRTSAEDRSLYSITNENDVVWVRNIEVGNSIFVKQ